MTTVYPSIYKLKFKANWLLNLRFHLPTYFSMQVTKVLSGTAPITASFFSPFLNIITVGMLRMPNWVAMSGLSSVLSL
uniref:Thioredoxin M-type n=1 Tax=Arundo donax TaxID=35708 RepID=A0A0A9H0N3_ARUDO